jgi:hypothetical protein
MMEKPEEVVPGLKTLDQILKRDETWKLIGDLTLEQHHQLIEEYALQSGVPTKVVQSYENARNTWLYSFFSYPLLNVAYMQAHQAGELALKERARLSGVDTKTKTLKNLLDMAIAERWLLDKHFSMLTAKDQREAKHRDMLRHFRIPFDPQAESIPEEDYAKHLVEAFRQIRNALPHTDAQVTDELSWEFSAIRDLINQLF